VLYNVACDIVVTDHPYTEADGCVERLFAFDAFDSILIVGTFPVQAVILFVIDPLLFAFTSNATAVAFDNGLASYVTP